MWLPLGWDASTPYGRAALVRSYAEQLAAGAPPWLPRASIVDGSGTTYTDTGYGGTPSFADYVKRYGGISPAMAPYVPQPTPAAVAEFLGWALPFLAGNAWTDDGEVPTLPDLPAFDGVYGARDQREADMISAILASNPGKVVMPWTETVPGTPWPHPYYRTGPAPWAFLHPDGRYDPDGALLRDGTTATTGGGLRIEVPAVVPTPVVQSANSVVTSRGIVSARTSQPPGTARVALSSTAVPWWAVLLFGGLALASFTRGERNG